MRGTISMEMLKLIPRVATDRSCMGIFKGCQHIGQERLGPKDIVIGENGNGCLSRLNSLDHLKTLVRFLSSEDFEAGQIETLTEFPQTVYVLLRCDNNDGIGVARCN